MDDAPKETARPRPRRYGVRSIGVWLQRRRIERFLEGQARFVFLPPGAPVPRGLDGLAGWGVKWGTREEARRLGMSYLALEDGFFRAAGLKGPSLSLTADLQGVHYDASTPCDLEDLIAASVAVEDGALKDARELMALMRREGLGKYNAAPDLVDGDPLLDGRPLVVVVDQIRGDKSVAGGCCGPHTFAEMLDAAVIENPGARVIARVHPIETAARRGHLRELAQARGVELFDRDVSWMSLARHAARVYVATSQAGLEALIAGAAVTCFGLPIYAGWGLTDDRQPCVRRAARPSLSQLVDAIYLRYARYLSPIDDQPCDAIEAARLLAEKRRHDRVTEGTTHVLGVQPWKHFHVEPFLAGARTTLTWAMTPEAVLARQREMGGRIVVWASREPPGLAAAAAAQGAPLVRMEDGFLRSVGLGANLEPPSSLVLDSRGIYYDPSGPSDLEHILQTTAFSAERLEEAADLRRLILEHRISKYNVGRGDPGTLTAAAGDRTRVLVPGQVTNDASVTRGGGDIRDNLALLKAAREARPDAFIVYKPHPDVVAGIRPGAITDAQSRDYADLIIERASVVPLLDEVDEVHTLTSLTGFEALLRGKSVSAYGLPFYAGWGLTEDRLECPRRTRRLTLDELVAGTLLAYPGYVSRPAGWPCAASDVVRQLSMGLHRGGGLGLLRRARTRTLVRYVSAGGRPWADRR